MVETRVTEMPLGRWLIAAQEQNTEFLAAKTKFLRPASPLALAPHLTLKSTNDIHVLAARLALPEPVCTR